jgi:hypothetical protein
VTTAAQAPDVRSSGERIEALLTACATAGPLARERAEELVRVVVELYGTGLERLLEIVYDGGGLTDAVLEQLADDDLVASLLLVHGLHPYGVRDRVEQALAKVRPYLGSHGGNVELLDVTDDGVVALRMMGSCDGCQCMGVTKQAAQKRFVGKGAGDSSDLDPSQGFGKFTPRARNAIVAVQNAAHSARNDEIGPGHLLLGLLSDPEALAAKAIVARGVSSETVWQTTTASLPPAADQVPELIPYSSRARKALELTFREACG